MSWEDDLMSVAKRTRIKIQSLPPEDEPVYVFNRRNWIHFTQSEILKQKVSCAILSPFYIKQIYVLGIQKQLSSEFVNKKKRNYNWI